ncbi:potassium transporter [Flammula alnicola]|nr:potassium transporter [Flammula alnicola]
MSSDGAAELGLNSKRTAVKVSGLALATLAFQTLGIIYSDIGTSPLYVLNGIWPSSGNVPSKEDVIGGISAIVWSLTLLPLCKYVLISLYFGTKEGEGGSFALYQGLYPRKELDFDADRTLTGDSNFAQEPPKPRTLKEKARWPLLLWCLFGTSLTMADGILTPAVSVTSAVAGIGVAKPSVNSDITPIAIVFLLALFFVQQFGTSRLAFTFAPISFIWFLLLMGTGIYNITFFPGIFRAFDPSRAILLFVRTKDYSLLAGVLLAVTGCEAMFANLGQFNAASIRIGFCSFVYPGLILAYLGQGARLIHDGANILPNVFYTSIPGPVNGPLYWIVFTFAVLATLIASQAMITATFSLLQQVINTKAFPPLRMRYTSETIQGQVYIPAANWLLMIGTIILVAAFKNLVNLTNAYGFAVATVMFSTSVLLAIQMRYVKHLPVVVGVCYFLVFGFFDALFWGAALEKVPRGAWVPLMIGCILVLIMFLWVWAKALEDKFDSRNRMNLKHFIRQKTSSSHVVDEDGSSSDPADLAYYIIKDAEHGSDKYIDEKASHDLTEINRIPSCAVFHKITSGPGVPHTFTGFIRQWPSLPRVVVFLSVCIVPTARVPMEDRYVVTKVRTVEGFYGVTYYIGFRDDFDVKVNDLVDKICELEAQLNPAGSPALIREIRAVSATTTHIVPHYHVVSKKVEGGMISPIVSYIRSMLIESIYRRLATMFPETANWLTSADEIIRVGINATI